MMVLDVFTNVAGLGECRGIGDGERYLQQPREGLSQQGLARPSRADQQDVRLLKLHLGARALGEIDALVVVVDGHCQLLLRQLLSDDVVVQQVLDLFRLGQARVLLLLEHPVFGDDVETDVDALIADEHRRTGDQLLDLALALVTKRAPEGFVAGFLFGHRSSVSPLVSRAGLLAFASLGGFPPKSMLGSPYRQCQPGHFA